MKQYHDPTEQIETEDKEIQDIIPPKEPYKEPITRSRIKTLEQNDSGALSSFLEGSNAAHTICYKSRQPSWQSVGLISSGLGFKSRPRQIYPKTGIFFSFLMYCLSRF
ncbi:hypothetical protein TNCV_175171 [Trichonephila clavipes]|nr:hypothetical protein TNCV_175171 [Trichonephila clavipes]